MDFWGSLKAVFPWTQEGRQADYAEERLDALQEFKDELNESLAIRKMVEMGMHDRALTRLMSSTEDQMYHDFHKHRYKLEQSGEWVFVPPSVQRKWRLSSRETRAVRELRAYAKMRRDRFLRIRALCGQVQRAGLSKNNEVITIIPEAQVDHDLLALTAGQGKKQGSKQAAMEMLGGRKRRRCHWKDVSAKGGQCYCTNLRMIHPHRKFRDEFGAMVSDSLTTCGWHARFCVAKCHGDTAVAITTANEGALCNECLAQTTNGPVKITTVFGAPGVRLTDGGQQKQADSDIESSTVRKVERVWNKWFTKGPGRLRRLALRPRHENAPDSEPPRGLRDPAEYTPPPPPPPFPTLAYFKRHLALAHWQVKKEKLGWQAAVKIQRTYRGYRARQGKRGMRRERGREHPERAAARVEAAIVMQSLVRRFLARCLSMQVQAFRESSALEIQRIMRGVLARMAFTREKAQLVINRQIMCYLARSFMRAARLAKKTREHIKRKNAVVLSLQKAWRGRKARKLYEGMRYDWVMRVGSSIIIQKGYRVSRARKELRKRRQEHEEKVTAAITLQTLYTVYPNSGVS
ncbi:unnamed protein product [Discosporangium mesarthrocarpum]